MEKTVGKISEKVITLVFYLGIIAVLTVPWWSKFIRDFFGYDNKKWYFVMIILMLSGIGAVYILYLLKKMYKTLLSGNPFVRENIASFRKMAVACACIALIYIIKCFFMFTLATVIIVFVFLIGVLFCLTLADIFSRAAYYKEEHDWTV